MPAPRFTHEVLLAILAWLTGICFHDAASGQDTGEPDAADRAYRAAVSYLHRELNDLAIEEYRKFLEVADAGHPQRPDARYGLAIAASRAENLDLAIASLHELNSINDYPRAVEARVLLGQCLLKTRQYREAATAFASASELSKKHPLLESAGALSIEAVYLGGEYEKVAEDGIVYLKKYPESRNQPRVAYFVADALLRLNKPEDAIKVAKRVLVSDGDHPLANAAQLVMARAYRLRKDYRQAADAYEALAARDIGALREDVLYELAQVFTAQDEFEKAAGTLDELIGKFPETGFLHHASLQRAQIGLRLNDVATAERLSRDVATANSELADEANYVHAQALMRRDDFRSADRLLSALAEKKAQPRASVVYDLAVCKLSLGTPALALDSLAGFEEIPGHELLMADALLLRLRAATDAGNEEAVRSAGRALLQRFPEHPRGLVVRLMLAEQAARDGAHDVAVDLLSQPETGPAANMDKKLDSQAKLRLAISLIAMDRAKEAEQVLQTLTRQSFDVEVRTVAEKTLAGLLSDRGEWSEAAKRWRSVRENSTAEQDQLWAALQYGICELRQENFSPALQALEFVTSKPASGATFEIALFEQGQTLLALKRLDDAATCFNQIVRDSADETLVAPSRRHLAYIAQAEGNVSLAAQHLETLAGTSGSKIDRADGAFLRAAALLTDQKNEQAMAAFDAFSMEFEDDPRRVEAQARGILAASRLGRCDEVLARIAKLEGSTIAVAALREVVQFAEASCLLKLDRKEEARGALERLEKAKPTPSMRRAVLVELASLDISQSNFAAAESRLKDARRIASEDNDKRDSLECTLDYYEGICAFHRNDFSAAATALAKVLKTSQDGTVNLSTVHLYSGESLFKLGRFKEAIAHLTIASAPEADPVQRRAALLRLGEAHAQLQQWSESESVFVRVLHDFGTDAQARFGVAWAQENMSRYPEAIENYREVADETRTERAARAQFQLGECYFALKDHERALRELMKVDILFAYPQWSAAALYEAARCLEALGRNTDARRQYTEVSEKYPDTRWAGLSRERLRANAPQLPGRGNAGE